MLGQPVSMLIPKVVGFKLTGEIPAGATATDVVLTITEMLREHGVVQKFVEFYGNGVKSIPLANRATIGNMSPEFGSTCAIFPIDEETIKYLHLTGRPQEQIDLVEAYAKAQGLWLEQDAPEAKYSEYLELDLSTVVPSIAGPKRPQDRILLSEAKEAFRRDLPNYCNDTETLPATTLTDLQIVLNEFRDVYNNHRPHQAFSPVCTPAAAWARMSRAPEPTAPIDPDDLLAAPEHTTRTVRSRGVLSYQGHTLYLGTQWAGEPIRLTHAPGRQRELEAAARADLLAKAEQTGHARTTRQRLHPWQAAYTDSRAKARTAGKARTASIAWAATTATKQRLSHRARAAHGNGNRHARNVARPHAARQPRYKRLERSNPVRVVGVLAAA